MGYRTTNGNSRSVFRAVKERIRTDDAARHYGVKISKGGMARCPFHDDRDPSMKIDSRYHCFGCGADGDVIESVNWRLLPGLLMILEYHTNSDGLLQEGWERE